MYSVMSSKSNFKASSLLFKSERYGSSKMTSCYWKHRNQLKKPNKRAVNSRLPGPRYYPSARNFYEPIYLWPSYEPIYLWPVQASFLMRYHLFNICDCPFLKTSYTNSSCIYVFTNCDPFHRGMILLLIGLDSFRY